MIDCTNCKTPNPEDAKFCANCGTAFGDEKRRWKIDPFAGIILAILGLIVGIFISFVLVAAYTLLASSMEVQHANVPVAAVAQAAIDAACLAVLLVILRSPKVREQPALQVLAIAIFCGALGAFSTCVNIRLSST